MTASSRKQNPKTTADRSSVRPVVLSRLFRFAVDEGKVEWLASQILGLLGVDDYALCISLVGLGTIRTLNRSFRKVDRPTDVLSFPQLTWPKPLSMSKGGKKRTGALGAPSQQLGDIVIAPARAEMNARAIGQVLYREICFLLIHGILHLCGHDHRTKKEEAVMIAEQNRLLAALASGSRRAPWLGCVSSRRSLGR